MTPKEIKALADACRKAGVKSFSCPQFSFELYEAPIADKSPRKSKKLEQRTIELPEKPFETDEPSEMDLLMYSVGGYSEIVPKDS